MDKRFKLRAIRIEGNSTVSAMEIKQLSGIKYGNNLFLYTLINHHSIGRRIVSGDPTVEAVKVLPDPPETMLLNIKERQPFIQIKINGGSLFLIDGGGVAYRSLTVRDNTLPVVVVPSSTPVTPLGKRVALGLDSPTGVGIYIVKTLQDKNSFQPLKLRDIRVDSSLLSTIVMSDRPMIKLGMPIDIEKKIETAAEAINNDPEHAGRAEYVDVSLPEKPAMKLDNHTPASGMIKQ